MATIRVIKNNKQREKTPGQKSNEALELEKQYRKVGKENQGERTDLSSKLKKSDHDSLKQAAEDVGVSMGTLQKGLDVKRMAYPEEYVHDDLRNPEKYDVSEEIPVVVKEYETFEDGMYDLVTDNTTHREKGRYSEMAIVRP